MGNNYQEQVEDQDNLITDEEVIEEDGDYEEDSNESNEEVGEEEEEAPEELYKKSQVQSIVKTRVGTMQKKIDKLSGYKGAVDKICEITGLNFEDLAERLNDMTVAQQAQLLGIPEEQIRATRKKNSELAKDREKVNSMSRELEIEKLKLNKNFADYDLYSDEIDDLLEDNPKLTIKQAYMLAKGDASVTAASRDAEQRAIAKSVNSQSKKVAKPQGSAGSTGPKISSTDLQAAKILGMDPAEYVKFKDIDNIDKYRANKKK